VKKVDGERSPQLESDRSTQFEYHYRCVAVIFRKWPFMNLNRNIIPIPPLLAPAAIPVVFTPTSPVHESVTRKRIKLFCETFVLVALAVKFRNSLSSLNTCIRLNVPFACLHLLGLAIIADCKRRSVCVIREDREVGGCVSYASGNISLKNAESLYSDRLLKEKMIEDGNRDFWRVLLQEWDRLDNQLVECDPEFK
jgi:hypothetical protein